MKPSTREWIRKAESDYRLAVALSRRRKVTFHDQACFHSQQSAEKYLKARLEEADIVSPKTHDLQRLLNLLLPVEPLWAALLCSVVALSQDAVEFRYLGHEATASYVKKALKGASGVRREARLALGLKVDQAGEILSQRCIRRRPGSPEPGPSLLSMGFARTVPPAFFHHEPPMLTIRDLKKSHGGRVLFEEACMQVGYGEKVALIGPNGAGKSTLFNIILHTEEPDSGTVERDEWTMIGYLPQEAEVIGSETVMDVATGRAGEVPRMEAILNALEKAGDVSSPAYLEAHAKHEALSDPQVEAKAKRMLTGLGYRDADFTKLARELSGGWVMRAHLARLLVMEPDLLMLDEPTNHLDLVSLLWLQQYLQTYSGAVLLISHDRAFMDEIVGSVYEIDERRLVPYTGNYADFLRLKEERYEQQNAAYKNQQKEIANLREFYDRFRQVASKASQAMSKLKQIERMELIEKPIPPRKPFRFQIPQPPRGGQRIIGLEKIDFAYGENTVYRGLELDVERGERTVLVGPNGSGKSTLLKLLAGVLEQQKGERKLGLNAKIGYFSQHRSATLDAAKTVLQEVMDSNGTLSENEARGILGSFLFRKDEIYKKTEVLSGGEKTRLNLIKFLVDPPNLLLMDEPTTHLDIHTVESLILALAGYEGTLVFISHDVHFIRKLATKVLHVHAGTVRAYPGGYDYFLEKTGALGNERAALTAG